MKGCIDLIVAFKTFHYNILNSILNESSFISTNAFEDS